MSEPNGSLSCKIPANTDISGVGVRSAIYAQNLLCLLSALWALWDGKVTQGKLDYAEMQTTTNLILAFAILISSIVQAYTLGISNYHANIVLMMSWMNNTNTFVYFILYIHHKIGLQESEGGVDKTWRAWVKHVKDRFSFTLTGSNGEDTEARITDNDGTTDGNNRAGAKILVKRFALVLGSLHLTLMAALGIWLWSDLRLFGMGNRKPGDFKIANACAVGRATLAVIGQSVPLSSSTLRGFSLAIYSLFLIPGVNLIPPMVVFLLAYFVCRRIPFAKRWDVLPAYIGLGILLIINLVFIVDIEVTRELNLGIQGEDEADWGFGQILAVLLLLLPFRDVIEAILARRLKQRQQELEEDLQEAIERQEFDRVKRAIERGSSFPSPKSTDQHWKFWNLISTHGELNYFDNLRRTRMTIIEKALEGDLHSAIREKDELRMTAAYNQGADLIAGVLQLSVDVTGMVFWYGISSGLDHIVWFHARQPGPHVNEQGSDGRTVLMHASEDGDDALVSSLLQNPLIDVNFPNSNGRTALLDAAEQGRLAIVKMLLARPDIQPNAADKNGSTPLIEASQNGRLDVTEILLKHDNIQPNAANKDGSTALLRASQNGHIGIVKILLERADIQPNAAGENGSTSLIEALKNSHVGIAEMLLEHDGIHPDAADKDDSTPLIKASQGGHVDIVEILLKRGSIKPNGADNSGRTPLMWASQKGHASIVKMLLEKDGIQPNAADKKGRTPLIEALRNGHVGVAKLLLKRGDIQPNAADKSGSTPLIEASQNGHVDIVELLLKHDDIQTNAADEYGRTPLMCASQKGHASVVKMLLKRVGIHPDVVDKEGRTPLICASLGGHEDIVEILLGQNASQLNVADKDGRTPLIWASLKGHQRVVKTLLKRDDIQANAAEKDGWNALIWASREGYTSIVSMLLERNDSQPNAASDYGNTPLMCASEQGHRDVVDILLEQTNIQLDLTNKGGKTAYDLAMEKNHQAVLRSILRHERRVSASTGKRMPEK